MIFKAGLPARPRAASLVQRRRPPQGLPRRYDRAALHGHVGGRSGGTVACRSAQQGLLPLCRSTRAGHITQMVAENAARLARGRLALGRRDRHQFGFDRHRDPEPRARARLSGFSARADAGRRRAVPRHRAAARRSARARAGAFRRGAGPQDRSGREVRLGVAGQARRRPLGRRRRRSTPSRHTSLDGDAQARSPRRWSSCAPMVTASTIPGRDDWFAVLVRTFQMHFRPARADGRLDAGTLDTLRRLVAALPAHATS